MLDKLFKAICSDYDMFEHTVLCIALVPLFGIWYSSELTKMHKFLYCGALLFVLVTLLLVFKIYLSKKAKEKGIKLVRQKDIYPREKWKTIIFFTAIGVSFILYIARYDKLTDMSMLFAAVWLIFLCLSLVMIEKLRYKKIDRRGKHGKNN